MRLTFALLGIFAALVSCTILQNGQPRITNYPPTVIDLNAQSWNSYAPSAPELSYKGRWDSKFISWWSAPGLKFGFTGDRVAITFGPYTTNTTLIAHRLDGQDWQFTNVTTNATHLLVNPNPTSNPGINLTTPITPSTFELRVTNWAYGVQISSVHVSPNSTLVKIPDFARSIEIIGDSLSAGQYATYEGLSSYSYGLGAGLGNTEYSITAYPGICLLDKQCYGNLRGQSYQWFHTSDTSGRAIDIWGDEPEVWDFSKRKAADVVVVNLGTNDAATVNNVTGEELVEAYVSFVEGIRGVWPRAEIILVSLWGGFTTLGNTYMPTPDFVPEILSVVSHFASSEANSTTKTGSVHYFNTTGLLQHNDISPQFHPTDIGHVKLASSLMMYMNLVLGWELAGGSGVEVQSGTIYWNDEAGY